MICPNCGANNTDGSSFCIKCGTNLKQIQEQLQSQNEQTATQLEQPIIQQNNNQYNTQQPMNNSINYNVQMQQTISNQAMNNQPQDVNIKKTNNKKLLIIILIIIIVIIFIVIGVKNFLSSATKNIDSLYSDNSLIRVKKDDKYGYIDSNGNFVIQPQYIDATPFYGDYARVSVITNFSGEDIISYEVIDKTGNVKSTPTFRSTGVEYVNEYNIWIINNQLYNGSLTKLSSDDIKVKYKDAGYLTWYNSSVGGIMTPTGKITYTYNFAEGESYIQVTPSIVDATLKDIYCRVSIESNKYGIVNCNTGKIIYDYTDKFIFSEGNNIFSVNSKENYELITILYIQNDKIIYQSSSEQVSLDYSGNGYITINDKNKNNSERYSYIDLSTGQITTTKPSYPIIPSIDEWEEFTNLQKFNCSNGYGLKNGENIIIPCEWSSIEYFDLSIYKYLSSIDKEYVIAEKNNKTYLINLKNGKSEAEFNTTQIYKNSESPFIYYTDSVTGRQEIYNLITEKSMSAGKNTTISTYMNYITLEENGALNYYNNNLKLIYTEE